MKATIKKVLTVQGENFFYVYSDDSYVRCFLFDPNKSDDDKWGEKQQLDNAMRLAKLIEEGKEFPITETIYETPNQ